MIAIKMNYKYKKNNNSEIIVTKNFIYKRFLKGSFDKKTIDSFCFLDKQFNKNPLIVSVLSAKDISLVLDKSFIKRGSKFIKIKKLSERSNGFYLLKKDKISNLNMSNIATCLYNFHFNSDGFTEGKKIFTATSKHYNVFLERAKKDKIFFYEIKDKIRKIFKETKFKYKKIRIHGDFLIENIFLNRQDYFYVDFGHLDKYSHDLFLKDVSSFYIDLLLKNKEDLAKHFLSKYLKLIKNKKIKSLIKVYNLNDLLFRYIINDGYYKKTDKNHSLLVLIKSNIKKTLND
jgi:hypothetical protein